MFFTRKSLEQATDEWIASYKAKRFAPGGSMVDACCGVGGDLQALAAVGDARGVDADEVLARFAERNAHENGVSAACRCSLLTTESFLEADAWHADPDRRPVGPRTSQPDVHEPSLTTLARWRERVPSSAIKFAPAARLPEVWQAECELEWISRERECKQLVAWCGGLARADARRVATRVDQNATVSFRGPPGVALPKADRIGDWIYEPDPAVLVSDLTGAIAERCRLAAAAPPIPYLTSDDSVREPLLTSFRVVETMPLDRKRLSGWLRGRGVGRLEIKCRGVGLQPEQLRRELKLRGDDAAVLLVFPDNARKTRVVVAQRP